MRSAVCQDSLVPDAKVEAAAPEVAAGTSSANVRPCPVKARIVAFLGAACCATCGIMRFRASAGYACGRMSPSMMSTGRGRGVPELRSVSRNSRGGTPCLRSSMNSELSSYGRSSGIFGICGISSSRELPSPTTPVRRGAFFSASAAAAAASSSAVTSSTVNPSDQKMTRTFLGLRRSGIAESTGSDAASATPVDDGSASEPPSVLPDPPQVEEDGLSSPSSCRAWLRISPTRLSALSAGSAGGAAGAVAATPAAGVLSFSMSAVVSK
mmetsp:Transcript_46916/g.123112  ORF Transcript_46916/g.123112 Transcript_46916/m.123112 type:complete len:268 (-) Transcript_46916:130-933(-)